MEKVQEYYDFIVPVVLEAGKIFKDVQEIEAESKGEGKWDIVTIYDRKIEDILVNQIKNKYPDHKHIAEEEVSKTKNKKLELTNSPTWIIDPIDATANFVRRIPMICISIGFTINKEQVLGIVYNPYMDELFTAIKGKGAFLNGQRIHTTNCTEIQKSLMEYPIGVAAKKSLYNLYMYRFKHLMKNVAGIRAFGGAVLGQCYVACGKIDAYQCDGLYPWDAAAGTLIVKEAGGYVADSSGKEFDLMNPNFIVTATKELCDQYLEVEKKADEERTERVI
ncbi:unnamed protein product [Ceutorhynchus assimilis]|uniref:Inositol-1-monophosphatase n=1 Tax=Ceutorhynchus assimilis TaxID=467358 RepID=A0A9N9MRJ8_9CUCU|nr:unnamed protein product [Ceutorhynchus assimilis]